MSVHLFVRSLTQSVRIRPPLCLLVIALTLLLQTGTAQAQRRYYVDSIAGNDGQSGLSAVQAWRSLDKVNAASLEAGDTVLFRRGGVWTGQIVLRSSGRSGQPITYDAYGDGADPVLTGGRNGFAGNGQSHIVIRNFQIRNVSGAGIQTEQSNDWTIDHVAIDRTGKAHVEGNREFAAVQWWHGANLTIANSTMSNIHGDAMFIWDAQNVKILRNRVEVCRGPNADNLHMYKVLGYEVRGNFFSMEGETDSGKGNFHSQGSDNGLVVDNVFRGGNYGVGNTDDSLIVENNKFFNQNKAPWSGAILVGEVYDVKNNRFVGNTIQGANMGIYIFQNKYIRENFVIRDNVFDHVSRAAVVIESPISGEFAGNIVRDSPGAILINSNGWIIKGQRWTERANVVLGTDGKPVKPKVGVR